MPTAVNKGQQVTTMKLSFVNEGSANGANVLITRVILNTENGSNANVIPKTAISRLSVKDASGTIYGDVVVIPDYGDSVSIALTTPITVQVNEKKDVYVVCDVNPDAISYDFKISLRSSSGIIARDANSYDLINVAADSGYYYPMKTSAALIQDVSQTMNIYHYATMPDTVNKGDTNVPVIYFKFINPNPAGYSDVIVMGLTITVEDNYGTGIVPSSVISRLKLEGPSLYGEQTNVPSYGSSVYVPLTIAPLIIPPSAYIGVTLYADVSSSTDRLFVQFDLKQGSDCYVKDKNSGAVISLINAEPGDSFPMRSGYATIYSPPGIRILHTDLAPDNVSENQKNVPVMKIKFTNDGSFPENLTGITLTVKDQWGNDANAELLINGAVLTDGAGNTHNAFQVISGSSVYLNLSFDPVVIFPRNYEERYVYVDTLYTTSPANFYVSLDSGSGISTVSPVTAETPDSFPMNTKLISLTKQSSFIEISDVDLMPPAVSTGQKNVFVFAINFENNSSPGYSPVVIQAITFTVKDGLSNTISAVSVITGLKLTDMRTDYYNTASITPDGYVACYFAVPLVIAAGEGKTLYCMVDVTGNTLNKAGNFILSVNGASFIDARDYYSGNTITPVAKAGYGFPIESSATLIQKRATLLTVEHKDTIPSFVSSGQGNVKTMNVTFTNQGDTLTASIMITRMNFYVQDELNRNINPGNVIKEMAVAAGDGSITYGINDSLTTTKTTINLTAPVVVSSALPVTLSVKVRIADSYLNDRFKIEIESVNDIYAVDANSFELVNVANKLPDVFPMKSGVASIENALTSINAGEFVDTLPSGVTKGEKRTGLFVFKLENNANTLTASAVLEQIKLKIKDGSNNDISANSAVEKVYLVDADGTTIASAYSSLLNYVQLIPSSRYLIAPGTYVYVSVYADILNTATSMNFKAGLDASDGLLIYDENKGIDGMVYVNYNPALPWETKTAGIYNAPATDLLVYHDGTSFIPDQVGRGQKNVKFMSLSMFNPAGPGTSDVLVHGVTITVFDSLGNTLAPGSVLDFFEFTDLTGTYFYGGVTVSAIMSMTPFYAEFNSPMSVPASDIITVYLKGKISSSADLISFKVSINDSDDVRCNNNPSGDVTVTAKSPDAFPMATDYTSVIASTNIVRISHENLMPVSIVRGQESVNGLKIIFKNENNIDMAVTGITITVKDRDGNQINADGVMSKMCIQNTAGDVTFAYIIPGQSSRVYFDLSSAYPQLLAPAFSQMRFVVSFDASSDASTPFMMELENPGDVLTDQPAAIQADAGDYFGNMKSTVVSIQEPKLTEDTYHNFPNPFNPDIEVTHIEYYLETPATVTIRVFNLEGKPVRTVMENVSKSGGLHYEDTWDGLNDKGKKVTSGVYICVLEVNSVKFMKKIAVLR